MAVLFSQKAEKPQKYSVFCFLRLLWNDAIIIRRSIFRLMIVLCDENLEMTSKLLLECPSSKQIWSAILEGLE